MPIISRGFIGRRPQVDDPSRLPPGQYLTAEFPVLSAGPTPRTNLEEWTFEVRGLPQGTRSWGWEEFTAIPSETITVDIHCVTKWSKFDTVWTGVSVDRLLEGAFLGEAKIRQRLQRRRVHHESPARGRAGPQSVGRLRIRRAAPGAPRTGARPGSWCHISTSGRARSGCAGWNCMTEDRPGFWETYGYHNQGDPWREQRYWGD